MDGPTRGQDIRDQRELLRNVEREQPEHYAAAIPGQDIRDQRELLLNVETQNTECNTAHRRVEHAITTDAQHSSNMVCGVCLDVVSAKENPAERCFAILPNCSHCYCLKCIQSWKQVSYRNKQTGMSCPECRTVSRYYLKSRQWAVDEPKKQMLIQRYKNQMAAIPCRYFRRGMCSLGPQCFYKHEPEQEHQTGASMQFPQHLRVQRWCPQPLRAHEQFPHTMGVNQPFSQALGGHHPVPQSVAAHQLFSPWELTINPWEIISLINSPRGPSRSVNRPSNLDFSPREPSSHVNSTMGSPF